MTAAVRGRSRLGEVSREEHAYEPSLPGSRRPSTIVGVGTGMMNRPPLSRELLLLAHDLVGEVPRQQQQVVGPVLEQARRRWIGRWLPPMKRPCLKREVHHVSSNVPVDAAVREQRAGLGGGAVAGDALALRAQGGEGVRAARHAGRVTRVAEVGVVREVASRRPAPPRRASWSTERSARSALLADGRAQRAAVDGRAARPR